MRLLGRPCVYVIGPPQVYVTQCQMGPEGSQFLGYQLVLLRGLNFSIFFCVRVFVVCGLLVSQVSGELVCPLLSWFRQFVV